MQLSDVPASLRELAENIERITPQPLPAEGLTLQAAMEACMNAAPARGKDISIDLSYRPDRVSWSIVSKSEFTFGNSLRNVVDKFVAKHISTKDTPEPAEPQLAAQAILTRSEPQEVAPF